METPCGQLRDQFKTALKLKFDFDREMAKILETKEIKDARVCEMAIKGLAEEMRLNVWEIKKRTPCSLERAEKILGKDYLGPETIQQVFGERVKKNDILPIPFSIADIERAKELNQFLILRIKKANLAARRGLRISNRQNITAKVLDELIYTTKNIDIQRGYEGVFYNKETPRTGWALVDKETVKDEEYDTSNMRYDMQLISMLDRLRNVIYKDGILPERYENIFAEFQRVLEDARTKGTPVTWDEELLEKSGVRETLRHTLVEAFYDIYVYYKKNKEWLFRKDGIATATTTYGDLKCFTGIKFDKDQDPHIYIEGISNPKPEIGAVISRRF